MKITTIVAIMSALIMHGAMAGTAPKKASLRSQLMSLIMERLKDPDSAKFSNLRVKEDLPGLAYKVCGTINAKNGYGGYIGASSFYASIIENRVGMFEIATPRTADLIENDLCRDVKTPL